MPQLTLVAHYGPKTTSAQRAFVGYVRRCQQAMLSSPLAPYFRPYAEEQLHGTLIGLEAMATEPGGCGRAVAYNANYFARRGLLHAMDLAAVLGLARSLPQLTIRFGGFRPDDDRIVSRGQRPYARSFQIGWAQSRVVIIGWHHSRGSYTDYTRLWSLRARFADECGVMHKYADDSDFYVTIGALHGLEEESPARQAALHDVGRAVEAETRQRLADPVQTIDLPVGPANLSIVRYDDAALPRESSRAHPVTEPGLSATELMRLYD